MKSMKMAAAALAVLCGAARAEVIWTMDPAKSNAGQFKLFGQGNCEEGGSIAPATDPERGPVMRWNKPSGSNRCENHGISVNGSGYEFRENQTYYFGWWSKLSSTANNNANFQWKSYGNHIQNFPIILKMIGGKMHLQYRPPGAGLVTVWSQTIAANAWYHYTLVIHTSTNAAQGWIEFRFDGKQQTLTNGTTRFPARSWDSGNHNCPKWGIYGASGTSMSNTIDDLKAGTDYESVKMEGASGIVERPLPVLEASGGGLRLRDLAGRALPGERIPAWGWRHGTPAAR